MRPVRVQMKGFGTFKQETTVDFSDLELLAFMGNTGSGKSTVIDAITFALFGRIARLDARAVAPVVNALSTEARVVLDFEVGEDRYTAARVVRRTPTGATTKEARLERDDEVLANGRDEVGTAIEELLGLDFERFTRVVMLPQGQFAEFLHDKPRDRQQLLRKLLGLQIYERLGQRARSFAAEAAAQLEVLRPKLETAEQGLQSVDELQAAIAELEQTQTELAALLTERRAAVTERDRLAKLAEDYGILVFAVAAIEVPDDAVQLGKRLDDAKRAHATATTAVADAKEALAGADAAVAAGPDRGRCERWQEQRGELEDADERCTGLMAELGELEEKQTEAARRLEALQTEHERLVAAAGQAAEAAAAAQQAVADGPDPNEITALRTLLTSLAETDALLGDQQAAHAEQQAAIDGAEVELAAADEALRTARQALDDIERENHAGVLAEALVAGEPCPVCQQVVDRLPDHRLPADLDDARLATTRAEQRATTARGALEEQRQRLTAIATRIDEATTRRAALTGQLPSGVDGAELDRRQQRHDELRAAAEEAVAARDGAAQRVASGAESAELKQAQSAAESLARAMVATSATLETTTHQRDRLAAALADAPSADELKEMLAECERLAGERAKAAGQVTAAEQAAAGALAELEAVRSDQAELRRRFSAARDEVVPLGAPTPHGDSLLADWQELAGWAADQREPLETQHREHVQATEAASAEVEGIDVRIRTATADDEGAADVAIDELDRFYATRLVSARAALATAEAQREQVDKDREQIEQLEDRREVHHLLGNSLLRSSGLEQWVMQEVIEALAVRAGERLLTLSGGQYSFDVESSDFDIRDHRNGDELREARTLSGGETFLASLSLALALADTLQDLSPVGSAPVESLFLDEGFGTLDPETLDVVAAAIEELGASGRMVGIITHIRELAERMPVRFEVTKGPATSTIARVEA